MRNEDRIANAALSKFTNSMVSVVRELEKRIAAMVAGMDTDGRNFVIMNEMNLAHSITMHGELLIALREAGYPDAVAALQASDLEIIRVIKETRSIPVAFSKSSKDVINALRRAEAFEFQMIGEEAMEAVRRVVQQAALTGAVIEESLESIEKVLNRRLRGYAWTYANTTRKMVIQAVHWEAASDYEGEKYWHYTGPDDDLTRPACQIGVGRDYEKEFPTAPFFTNDEMLTFESVYAEERTYNCRHYFVQITEHNYNKKIEEAV